ncbi:family 78 glycoside hydrolase catalytic domain [Paenibacillus silvae]|uniref:family 78 glycoside hydrolase catalytic domain n=2 Tax=Paenibacillus silvae TaxID=1325358 RepID=UPI002005BCE5|nr:family 78 glycoside hydrolase catalytic domain [Paenibacillus silvae]MCK6076513.1 family 78 glycoside hydrolase catalytic domain [Paenibacillus silvae]MCK6150940.1 family 78 glycoside hydrolase catalytic domain [Paenibacillus silvae]MCK6269200.1 family 78 glycoside hydrolase catalytic domain [Paenibacillus silvae]
MLKVNDLRCEYRMNPIGLDVRSPRLSWKLESDRRNCMQLSYQVQLSHTPDFADIVWDTQELKSDQSVHVELEGFQPAARTRYYYRVRVRDAFEEASGWSDTAFFEMGRMEDSTEWTGEWITASISGEPDTSCPRMRKCFQIVKPVLAATIYATALGLYELHLNHARVGDAYFTPGWTTYSKRLQYQTYDVTHQLQSGDNVLGVYLGDGWYRGYLGWNKEREIFGSTSALLLELHIRYADGSEEVIGSNEEWSAAPSAIRMSDIYMGETYDARMDTDWGDQSRCEWSPVEVLSYPKNIIVAQENVPVMQMERLQPTALLTTPQGDRVLDMGQNMVGWMRFSIEGNAGQTVELHHAEILDHEGNFYVDNLRAAKQRIRYTFHGEGVETYEPHFTFQGFRYVKLIGFPEKVTLDQFTGVVLHSNMDRTGDFACSNSLVNQLHHNIVWGQKGNFLDVPTDCPQRDERLGWTGDAQMFIRTSAYLMNTAPFFTKWLRDLRAEQGEDGGIPFFVPDLRSSTSQGWGDTSHSSAAWGDAAVICPWVIYEMYGDMRLLKEQYESMQRWVAYIYEQGENAFLWNTGFHFGDWLALDSKSGSYVGATDIHYVATAFYAYSVSLTRKAAAVLGKLQDVEYYDELHRNIVKAFRDEYVTPAGRIAVPTQTAHVLALQFGLLETSACTRAAAQLTELLKETQNHLTTGFVGTPYLNPVLSDMGRNDLAYELLLQEDYPSWLYQVTEGATTVWEHWDGMREDGSLWSADMNSFNHYAYGAIGEWLYRYVAGIRPDEQEPGFKKVHIKPHPGPGLEWAEASYESMYGNVKSSWHRQANGVLELCVQVPANTSAEVRLPNADRQTIMENGRLLDDSPEIQVLESSGTHVDLTVGSGNYRFIYSIIEGEGDEHSSTLFTENTIK